MLKNVLFVVLLFPVSILAQQEHAWVYFSDKQNVQEALDNPITILTQEAIDRKNLHGVAIDVRDVPITPSHLTSLAVQNGITIKATSKWMNCAHVLGGRSAIEALIGLPFVVEVAFSNRDLNAFRILEVGEDAALHQDKFEVLEDFDYGNTGNQAQMIKVNALHQMGYTGEGMIIAVMDSGFPNVLTLEGFQRLRDNGDLLGGYDFVARSADYYDTALHPHGTRVLSCMAGFVENQYVGTAPDASYYLFRTEDATSETPVEESYWVEAAERADSLGVDVINTSLGYSTFDNNDYSYTPSEMDGQTAFITLGANIAMEKGMLVVNSAGNAGNSSWGIITAPADGEVFAVGAVNATGDHVSFSSRGPTADNRIKPNGMAQGSGTTIITENDALATSNGTSFSAPVMAGALACLWQAIPSKTNTEVIGIVQPTGTTYDSPTPQMGYGIPDLAQALNSLGRHGFLQGQFGVYPNPASNRFAILFPPQIQTATVLLYDLLGKQVCSFTAFSENPWLDITELSKGIYLVKITAEKASATFKIIKR